MTTPNQPAPSEYGTISVGGGDFRYNQDMTEEYARALFTVPSPTSANALDLLASYLLKLPIEALRMFQELIGGSDADFLNPTVATDTIMASLGGSIFQDITDGINAVVSSLVSGFTGLFGDWTVGDETQPIADAAANISALGAQIAALQQSGNPGQAAIIDFSLYGNSTNLPSMFTQSYSTSTFGNDPYGITNGRAQRGMSGNNNDRATQALFNTFVTDTDYQLVAGIWTAKPSNDGFGNRGHVGLRARVDATDAYDVYVKFASDSAELGTHVAGTKTVFTTKGNGGSGTFSFKAGAVYDLLAGDTVTGLRVFMVRENNVPFITFTDSSGGGVSSAGASFRGSGLLADWPSNLGNIKAGEQLIWAIADNN